MDTLDHEHEPLASADRPTDDCAWCWGYFDGYMAGMHGLDPDGNRHNFNPELLGNPEYNAGRSAGLADRITH